MVKAFYYKGDDGRMLFLAGVQVATNTFDDNSAYQLGGTIYIGEDWRNSSFDINILAHEYGHYLQEEVYGTDHYIINVGIPSLWSAVTDPANHDSQWYEADATKRGEAYMEEYSVYITTDPDAGTTTVYEKTTHCPASSTR
jgi:hypothetical protein